jgi:hypothetical protein
VGVRVIPGGTLRGADVPGVVARPASRPRGWSGVGDPARWVFVPGGESLLVQLDAPAPAGTAGAAWAVIEGALGVDSGCRSTAAITVWAADSTLGSTVGPLADALAWASDVADLRFGPAPHRLAVALGGTWTGFDGMIVWLGADEVRRAGSVHELARLAVAARRLADSGDRDWTSAEAVARSFGP